MDYRQLAAGIVIGLIFGVGVTSVMAQNEKDSRGEVVISEGLAATRDAPTGKSQITIMAEGENAFMGKLRVKPGAVIPPHEDSTEEYLYVLEGSGTLTINGTDYDVGPKTGVYMPAGAKVTFQNNDALFEAVQLFAGPKPANKYSKWETGASPWKAKSGAQKRNQGGGGGSINL